MKYENNVLEEIEKALLIGVSKERLSKIIRTDVGIPELTCMIEAASIESLSEEEFSLFLQASDLGQMFLLESCIERGIDVTGEKSLLEDFKVNYISPHKNISEYNMVNSVKKELANLDKQLRTNPIIISLFQDKSDVLFAEHQGYEKKEGISNGDNIVRIDKAIKVVVQNKGYEINKRKRGISFKKANIEFQNIKCPTYNNAKQFLRENQNQEKKDMRKTSLLDKLNQNKEKKYLENKIIRTIADRQKSKER